MIPLSVCLSLSSLSPVVVCFQCVGTASFLCVNSILVSVCVCVQQFTVFSLQISKLHEVILQGAAN